MEPIPADKLIEYSRSWLGTPWHHNQRCKGVGADCISFTMDCFEHFGARVGTRLNYDRKPQGDSLLNLLDSLPAFKRSSQRVVPGQLVVFRVFKVPHHVGIVTSSNTFIHAHLGVNRVIEQEFLTWKKRIATCYDVYA